MPSAIIFNPFVFPSLFFLISSTIPTTISTPDFVYKDCSNATFATNSSYQTNLNSVLTSLSSNSTTQSGFYNTTAGDGGASTIYGIFLCRGDDTEDVCRTCVATAVSAVPLYCPNSKQAIIWYDVCMIRYSNASFFGELDESVAVDLSNVNNITNNATGFTSVLDDTMNKIALTAAKGQSGKKFATADANFNVLQKLYTLAQCTPDLSSSDCYTCLTDCIGRLPSCCSGKKGGRVLFPSCNIRYEIALFYENTTAAPAPVPQLVAPPPAIGGNGKKSKVVIIAVVIAVISALFITLICCCLWRRRTKSWKKVKQLHDATPSEADVQITTAESLQFNFETIRAATDNFAEVKKLGRGGFGAVYKGKLPNGQEIAVKRLARNSGQGDLEFKNEVQIVAKLQHKNLVRLLSFCLEGEERLLIYEFMPNTSLDHFLFDSIKRAQLNWAMRYKIIVGVARGLLYLHEDSRLRIIHRDLKASNILLDTNMNAKISDFGMARLFPIDQTHADTRRIVGTYGYMAPEYAMHGFFSVKSDVYSFGVLVLEIVSGQKNYGISSGERIEDLITQVWKDWREGKALNIVDPTMLGGSRSEMMRCIHIGLLCVQENEADRPTMSSVVVMLSSHSLSLPMPREPAYFLRSGISSATQSQDYSRITEAERSITNEEPITQLHYR